MAFRVLDEVTAAAHASWLVKLSPTWRWTLVALVCCLAAMGVAYSAYAARLQFVYQGYPGRRPNSRVRAEDFIAAEPLAAPHSRVRRRAT